MLNIYTSIYIYRPIYVWTIIQVHNHGMDNLLISNILIIGARAQRHILFCKHMHKSIIEPDQMLEYTRE